MHPGPLFPARSRALRPVVTVRLLRDSCLWRRSWLWVRSLLGAAAGAWVAAVTLLWPGAINSWLGQSYSVKASWGVSRIFFESVTLGALGAMVLLGIVF